MALTNEEIMRHPSGQAKATSRDQFERREHWRKADRDDRGPESRLLPVDERDSTRHPRPAERGPGNAQPQADDPTGQGFMGTSARRCWWDCNPNSGDPHPDDPHDIGYLADVQAREFLTTDDAHDAEEAA